MIGAAESSSSAQDVIQRATRVAEMVTGQQRVPDGLPKEPFWREQIAQSVSLHQAGNSRQALKLLKLRTPHVRPAAQIKLLKPRMFYRRGEAEASAQAAREAVALATSGGAVIVGSLGRKWRTQRMTWTDWTNPLSRLKRHYE